LATGIKFCATGESQDLAQTTLKRLSLKEKMAKRLMKDITAATQDPTLATQGIWYVTDPASIRLGYALIRGVEKTPYSELLGLFRFEFPEDYPFAPPRVTWLTGDGFTRFHPQLYREGKVCLSILGTWSGPGWASTLNLVSILQVLQTLFVENPLSNEPGYEKGSLEDPKYRGYADFVEHQSVAYMIQTLKPWVEGRQVGHPWAPFADEIQPILPDIIGDIVAKTSERAELPSKSLSNLMWGMFGVTRWKDLAVDAEILRSKIEAQAQVEGK